MTWMPLKEYQQIALDALGDYCAAVQSETHRGAHRPERDAFEKQLSQQARPDTYYDTPYFRGTPYVCLRLPTGGGKTLLAAHAVGQISHKLLGKDHPVCLWITPNKTVREQTRRRLQDKSDPYYHALRDGLGCEAEVVSLDDVIGSSRYVTAAAPVVIVTTIQSYRIRNDKGEELADTRRIYRDNGYMLPAFEDVPELVRQRLARDERGNVDLSLANALMLRQPIVIIDEAHNARTPTSFESLARFGPSFVLELTATPQLHHDPDHPTDPSYASNVLHAASALELQKEGMIKLPVELESRGDWLEVLAATVQRREALELKAAEYHEMSGRPLIRPIALIQAQPNSRTKETHTAERVKAALVAQLHVDENEVRICTGAVDEIGEEDLMSEACRVCYVITVEKLREGWDCPFAYVLGSIGNAATPTAVEQLIGRVLRMPGAVPTRVPALDRAYAFVLSDDVQQTAMQLRDRMVETCGFDDRSAAEALRVRVTQTAPRLDLDRIPLSQSPDEKSLPPTLVRKSRYDDQRGELVLTDAPSPAELQALREVVQTDADREAVDEFWERGRPVGAAAKRLDEYALPLRIGRLTIEQDGVRTLFEPQELDNFAWNLDACEAELTESEFSSDLRVGEAVRLDVDAARGGGLVTETVGEVRLTQLELVGEGFDWDARQLTRWLDGAIHQGDRLLGLPMAESQPWLHRVVRHLTEERGMGLPMLVRRRHALADLLRVKIADHGRAQTRRATNEFIDLRPEALRTLDDDVHAAWVEEQDYRPDPEHVSTHVWKKHAFTSMLSMNGEEDACAREIDKHPGVHRWLRNAERTTQGGFWLPKSPGKFFPDFLVERTDGVIVIVEYKMKKMENDPEEQQKKAVGELWEQRSDGRGRFAWIVDKDWTTLEGNLDA